MLPAGPPPPRSESLACAASAGLRAWSEGLSPALRGAFRELMAGSGLDADDGARDYLKVMSQPVVAVPAWFAGGVPEPVAQAAVGSALAGYLAVRLHDDWMDEGRGDPTLAMMLGTALLARHAQLAARVTADPRWWSLHEKLWQRYAEAMLLERELLEGRERWDDAAYDRVLGRSEPLLLPAAALLAARGRWSDLDMAHRLVAALVRAHQAFDDLRDATSDFQSGRRTRLAAGSGARDMTSFAAWLFRDGADVALGQAEAQLDLARASASTLDLPSALDWIDQRRAAMHQWRAAQVGAYLARVLGTRDPSTPAKEPT